MCNYVVVKHLGQWFIFFLVSHRNHLNNGHAPDFHLIKFNHDESHDTLLQVQ